jgi:hypothetical protein
MLPRPDDAVPPVDSPDLPSGVAIEELANALCGLAAASLGNARPGSEQHRRAIDLLETAVAGDPVNAANKIPLADAYVDSGNSFATALACELYAEALVDYSHADALLARAVDACLALGNDEGAFAAQRFAAAQGAAPAAVAQMPPLMGPIFVPR